MKDKIFVTQPFLPPLEEFIPSLQEIWRSKWLTNGGKFHQELELALCEYLGVKYLSLFSNGTLALITALQALRITGEVITTPFSFVATSHALHWNGIAPVFCDIDQTNFCLNPLKIEAAITPRTTAILPVHVYGVPCNIKEIQRIADTYGLRVVYDSAHAFGVKVQNHSILEFGDLSILSFHATKIYNTFEGGAIICHDEKMKKRIDQLKNFGFADEVTVLAPGINAKMNEIQSAIGLLQLKYIDANIQKNKIIDQEYRTQLKDIQGISVSNLPEDTSLNYSYFPILVDKQNFGKSRDELYEYLKGNNIFSRRYFYPLISNFPTYSGLDSSRKENLPVANIIADKVLCLPIYPELPIQQVKEICRLIKNC
jgi:dTDP-4-amino-4,6-dideoxygalactose transaminase